MKLIMSTSPYRLELGYELGFGSSVYDSMAELILAFHEPDQNILFLYTNWDRKLVPHRDRMIQNETKSFHADVIYDPEEAISRRVKEILLHHYAPELDPNDNQTYMDELLAQFREAAYEELNEELLLKIGTAVHDMNSVYTLEDQNETTQAFVNSRLMFTNSTWLFTYDRPVNLKNILWYKVSTKEEIIESFELTDWWFKCVILNADTPVEECSYFLNYTEEHGDNHDGMVLYISPESTDSFKENVLPRLQNLVVNKLEIVS
ncbi:hypothetical protein [Cohnella endophytica]|nr:hypothetical protein [Cohnella endophytica]